MLSASAQQQSFHSMKLNLLSLLSIYLLSYNEMQLCSSFSFAFQGAITAATPTNPNRLARLSQPFLITPNPTNKKYPDKKFHNIFSRHRMSNSKSSIAATREEETTDSLIDKESNELSNRTPIGLNELENSTTHSEPFPETQAFIDENVEGEPQEYPVTESEPEPEPEPEIEEASGSSDILSISPSDIDFVPAGTPWDPFAQKPIYEGVQSTVESGPNPFVKMFRGSAVYIASHRNSVAVYHIPGEFLEYSGFADLMDDIALTWLLGMKIVIVVGCSKFLLCKYLQSLELSDD